MTGEPPKPSCHFSIKLKKSAYSISSRHIKQKSNTTSDKCSTITVPLPLNARTMIQSKSVIPAVNSFSKVCVVPFADAEPFRYGV